MPQGGDLDEREKPSLLGRPIETELALPAQPLDEPS